MAIQKKIIVTGIFRSGTTLLTRMLAAHSDMFVTYQPITPLFRLARNKYVNSYMNKDMSTLPIGIDYFADESEENEFKKNILNITFSADEKKFMNEEIRHNLNQEPNEKPQFLLDSQFDESQYMKFNDILDYYYDLHQKFVPQKNIIGIKEVWVEEFIEPLITQNNFYCLHIVRDPRAIYASRNTGKYLKDRNNKKYPIMFFILSWRRTFNYYQKLKMMKQYKLLRYEDLVAQVESKAKEICEFLDTPFDPDMTDPSLYIGGDGKPWKANSTTKEVRYINKESTSNWKNTLSEEEIGMLEFTLQNEMKALGYERVTTFDQADFLKYQENEDEVIDWLRKPEFLLTDANKEKLIKALQI